MRAILLSVLLLFAVASGAADAQVALPLDVGSPEAAFAGGPIKLSKLSATMLRAHYQGDKVPLVPQPWRGRLDAALLGGDWPRAEAVKKELITARGIVQALAWEQSRFVATGSVGVAEMHALDLAATGSSGVSETSVMMWLYAVAVTMTDGHKCTDEAAKDAYLDKLRGPSFAPVLRLVQTLADDRLAAMRDLAVRLENVLAPERADDTMCTGVDGRVQVKPDVAWKVDAGLTRQMLPKHLLALTSVMRPKPIARPEPPRPEIAAAKSVPAPRAPAAVSVPEQAFVPDPVLGLPVPFTADPTTAPPPVATRNDTVTQQTPSTPDPPPRTSDPAQFEPPGLQVTTPGTQAGQ